MNYPKIFDYFDRQSVIPNGASVYDFLGSETPISYKKGWKPILASDKKFIPARPSFNEWMADWVATLLSAHFADDDYCSIELGAGYGQWSISAANAFLTRNPNGIVKSFAVEGDQIHYAWLAEAINLNKKGRESFQILPVFAAMGRSGFVDFPVIDPEQASSNYGASYLSNSPKTRRVTSHTLNEFYQKYVHTGQINLLHIDIQGAEKDLFEEHYSETLDKTRVILVGTHRSEDLHNSTREKLEENGFSIILEWPRNSEVEFFGHPIKTNDGALLGINSKLIDPKECRQLILQ